MTVQQKNWLTGADVIRLTQVAEFELLNFLKAGLPGYTWHGKRVLDVDTLEHVRERSLEEIERGFRAMKHLGSTLGSSGPPMNEAEVKFRAKLVYNDQPLKPVVPKDCIAMSFALPTDGTKALRRIEEAKSLRFKFDEVMAFLQNAGILPVARPAEPKAAVIHDETAPTSPTAEPSAPTIENGCPRAVFRPSSSGVWEIGLEGKVLPFPDLDGFHYIQDLLKLEPGQRKSATELYALRHHFGGPKGTKRGSIRSKAPLPTMDTKAVRELRKKIKDLESEIEEKTIECEKLGISPDDKLSIAGEIVELKEEKASIEAHLKKTHTITGKIRSYGSSQEDSRKKVSKAINLALAKIIKTSREMAPFLYKTIEKGNDCYYSPKPEAPVTWILE